LVHRPYLKCFDLGTLNLVWRFVMTSRWNLLFLGSLGQWHIDFLIFISKWFWTNNSAKHGPFTVTLVLESRCPLLLGFTLTFISNCFLTNNPWTLCTQPSQVLWSWPRDDFGGQMSRLHWPFISKWFPTNNSQHKGPCPLSFTDALGFAWRWALWIMGSRGQRWKTH
jgi:hypothetical protein